MMCRDGKACHVWFGADGSLFCRHGLVAEASPTTGVDWKCPLDLLEAYEKEKWEHFMKIIPEIKKKFYDTLRPTKIGEDDE